MEQIPLAKDIYQPLAGLWPSDDIEVVLKCPVCTSAERVNIYSALVDNAFRAAPGAWSLWQCARCRSAYLDPRPTRASIHRAYANYYTHKDGSCKADYNSLGALRKMRRRMVNGYTNWAYLTKNMPASVLGVLAACVLPSMRKSLSRKYRHLPKVPAGGGVLLDVGCGNGEFLKLARNCGWDVVGLDPDPGAVANAGSHCLTVHMGGIEYYDGNSELFDVITLNHVIEHVYEPVKVLEACHKLLKPGGQLWLETPNIDSLGHARFKKDWRGLEAPRHLVLFNLDSLRNAFVTAGFAVPFDRPRQSPCRGMYQASFAMANGYLPDDAIRLPMVLKLQAWLAGFIGGALPSRREFLTVTARKELQ